MKQDKAITRFEVFLFSPDGYFTEKEVQELIEQGFKWQLEHKGLAYRLSPITVEAIHK